MNKLLAFVAGVLSVSSVALASAEPRSASPKEGDFNMNKTGQIIHGFKLLKIENVKEADSVARLFEHVYENYGGDGNTVYARLN